MREIFATISGVTQALVTVKTKTKIANAAVGEPIYRIETLMVMLNAHLDADLMQQFSDHWGKEYEAPEWLLECEGCLCRHNELPNEYVRIWVLQDGRWSAPTYETASGKKVDDETLKKWMPKQKKTEWIPLYTNYKLESIVAIDIVGEE